MNGLSRSVLTLYSYDTNPDDTSLPNVLRQCLNLISVFPLLSVYGYQAYNHYIKDKSLYIHNPKKELTTAENILRMLRRIRSIHIWRQRSWILRLSFIWNMAEVITLHSQLMWFPHQELIHILRLPQHLAH